nr:Chain C, PRO-ARG-SER-PHE-LEU-VAL-ARG-ARG-PRO [Homo sapiens]
PRSFLVRRP